MWFCYSLYCRCIYRASFGAYFSRHSFRRQGVAILSAPSKPFFSETLHAVNLYLDPLLPKETLENPGQPREIPV